MEGSKKERLSACHMDEATCGVKRIEAAVGKNNRMMDPRIWHCHKSLNASGWGSVQSLPKQTYQGKTNKKVVSCLKGLKTEFNMAMGQNPTVEW